MSPEDVFSVPIQEKLPSTRISEVTESLGLLHFTSSALYVSAEDETICL